MSEQIIRNVDVEEAPKFITGVRFVYDPISQQSGLVPYTPSASKTPNKIYFTLDPLHVKNGLKRYEVMMRDLDIHPAPIFSSPENEMGIEQGGRWGEGLVILDRRRGTDIDHFNRDHEDAMLECWGKYMTDGCKQQLSEAISDIAAEYAIPARGAKPKLALEDTQATRLFPPTRNLPET